MATDLEAIKRKLQEMNRRSSVQLWKPAPGKHKVRGLPWKQGQVADGTPFIERKYYYLGSRGRIPVPSQFGKPDPVNDLIRKLYSTKNEDDRARAKKLQAKIQAYMPVIVSGEEAKGVQVWGFNTFTCERLLKFFIDDEVNPDMTDYLDPYNGLDLLVEIKTSAKKFDGRDVMDITIDLGRKLGPIHPDKAVIAKWLESVPDIDGLYPQKTTEEINAALDEYVNGGPSAPDTSSAGTMRGSSASVNEELNKLADELKAPKDEGKAKRASAKRAEPDVDADPGKKPAASIDSVFDELVAGLPKG